MKTIIKGDFQICISVPLTNSPMWFQATLILKIGLSDLHKMTVAGFKISTSETKNDSYRN